MEPTFKHRRPKTKMLMKRLESKKKESARRTLRFNAAPGQTIQQSGRLGELPKNDRPGYSCERTPWVLVTGAEPLNHSENAISFPFLSVPVNRWFRSLAASRSNGKGAGERSAPNHQS
jgi:hypothetical protein